MFLYFLWGGGGTITRVIVYQYRLGIQVALIELAQETEFKSQLWWAALRVDTDNRWPEAKRCSPKLQSVSFQRAAQTHACTTKSWACSSLCKILSIHPEHHLCGQMSLMLNLWEDLGAHKFCSRSPQRRSIDFFCNKLLQKCHYRLRFVHLNRNGSH